MIITRTPYRISLFGGGTDYPQWYTDNIGAVLSFSIDKFCFISLRELPPFFDHKYRISYSKIELAKEINEIVHPVVREAVKIYAPELSLEIQHHGDLPASSGVGSSSAFAVGLIKALTELTDQGMRNIDIAKSAIDLEQRILKENVGSQDQIACAMGGLNLIEFGPNQELKTSPLAISLNYVSKIESSMVLIYSGISRNSSKISESFVENISTKSDLLNKSKLLAYECKQIFESEGNLENIGYMLREAWDLKQKMNPKSIIPALSDLFANAYKCGAIGGKVLGAGGGGFCLFWVDPYSRDLFIEKMKPSVYVPFKISYSGSTRIL